MYNMFQHTEEIYSRSRALKENMASEIQHQPQKQAHEEHEMLL